MNASAKGRTIRVLIAKPGLDGHDRGAKVIAHALRDAGMEVIYTGLHKTVEEIAAIALQEDVDVIGLSIYSGTHLYFGEKLMEKLREKKMSDTLVLIGGNIPRGDMKALHDFGVNGVFPTGTIFDEIVTFIREKVRGAR